MRWHSILAIVVVLLGGNSYALLMNSEWRLLSVLCVGFGFGYLFGLISELRDRIS